MGDSVPVPNISNASHATISDHNDPGHADPIGTLRELKKLGLNPMKYGSCSKPSQSNRGCPCFHTAKFGECPVRVYLAQLGQPGPEFVKFESNKGPGRMKEDVTHCYTYMGVLAPTDQRIGLYRLLGVGGQAVTLTRRGTQVAPGAKIAHPVRFIGEKVPRMPRPNESMLGVVASRDSAQAATASPAVAVNASLTPAVSVPGDPDDTGDALRKHVAAVERMDDDDGELTDDDDDIQETPVGGDNPLIRVVTGGGDAIRGLDDE